MLVLLVEVVYPTRVAIASYKTIDKIIRQYLPYRDLHQHKDAYFCITASRSCRADRISLPGAESGRGEDRAESEPPPSDEPFLLRGVALLSETSMLAI